MRLLITFLRTYPLNSALMLFALLLAGIAEGFGITALLPLLGIITTGGLEGKQLASEGVSTGDPGLAQAVMKTLAAAGLSPTIGVLLGVVVTGIVLKSAFMLLANRRVGYTVAHVATDMRLALLRALLNTRWEYYLSMPVGGLANAFATEAMRASQAYLSGARMSALLLQALVYSSVALLVSWKATLVAIAAGMILLYGLNRLVRMARRAGARQTELLHSLLARLTDSLQSIKPLKAMAREDLADAVLETETNQLNRAQQKQVFSNEALRALQEPMLTVFLVCGLYVALVRWALPPASVMVLTFLLARLLIQLGKVQEQYQKMVIFESAYWSLRKKIREAEGERETVVGRREPSLEHGVRLDQVSFRYGDSWVLNGASLEFPAGSFTAITGTSGVGKTTVADLIMGLLQPQEGCIFIDALPLAEVDLRRWRRMIGYVPQETLLLHDTVMRNVTLGDPAVSEQDAENALRLAGAWGFFAALPQRLNSTVGERGGKLSGGQRQRIVIARALVHKPALLILDEATSGLDPESEASIYETLRQLRGKLTIIAISHQPAAVTAADRSYRLHDGEALLVTERPGIDSHRGTSETIQG